MKALILAGGLGKRLRPYTENTPKPLVIVATKPIIVWQIEWLKNYGITDFVVACGYKREKVIEYLGNGRKLGVKIGYVVEDEPLGTGGAIKNAEPFLKNEGKFIVINGDIITNLNPLHLVTLDEHLGSIALVPLPSPYGIVETEGDKVKSFKEKPLLEDYWINAGVYCFSSKVFSYLPEKGDIEREVFPVLAEKGLLKAVKYTNVFWKSIDTVKDLEIAEKILSKKSR
ncbi:MAG: nucleotidyltransferase family protein [Thermoproteales archaeon]|nr:nucleotidyltransferase family protein [Thermoproteales archaeon]